MSNEKLQTIRGYAKYREVAPSAVRKAIKTGRISTITDENGKVKIDPTIADQEWHANTDPKFFSKEARDFVSFGRKNVPKKEPITEKDLENFLKSPEDMSLAEARRMREVYQAFRERLEYQELEKTLVNAEAVRTEYFEQLRSVRDQLLNIPTRLDAILASESDRHRVGQILTEELIQALETICDQQ